MGRRARGARRPAASRRADEGDYASRYWWPHEARDSPARAGAPGKSDLFAWTEAPSTDTPTSSWRATSAFPPACPTRPAASFSATATRATSTPSSVSNRGYFRLDLVFSGQPRPLVAWTEVPGQADGASRGARRPVLDPRHSPRRALHDPIDDKWAAEAEDEGFDRATSPSPPKITARTESWGKSSSGCAPAPSSRGRSKSSPRITAGTTTSCRSRSPRRLAQTFFAMGESWRPPPDPQDREAQAPRRRGVLPQGRDLAAARAPGGGRAALDACLELDPGDRGRRGKGQPPLPARALPRAARQPRAHPPSSRRDSARLLCLSGHARFGLGDYHGRRRGVPIGGPPRAGRGRARTAARPSSA